MSNSTEKNPAPNRVAVVADQSADGSFELRVERPSDSSISIRPAEGATPPSAAVSVSNLKSDAPEKPENRRGRAIGFAAGGVAAVGIAGAFALTISGDERTPEPPVVEPEPAETFRAFTIQAPAAPNIPRAMLAMDVGADTVDQEESDDDGEESAVARTPRNAQSPPPIERTAAPEPIPSVNPAAAPHEDLAQRLQNVRVSAAPLQNVVQLEDDEYDEYDDYDEEYDEYEEYDDEEFD